jgi:uncharacterized protein YjbJ (UPF0337 family)
MIVINGAEYPQLEYLIPTLIKIIHDLDNAVGTEAITQAQNAALSAIDAAKIGAVSDAQTEIGAAQANAENAISAAKDTATGEITSAKTAAKSAITRAKNAATEAVATAKDTAISEAQTAIANAKDSATSAISTAQNAATGAIAAAKEEALDALDGAGGIGGAGELPLTEIVKTDVVTGDAFRIDAPHTGKVIGGLTKAYKFVQDDSSAVDTLRTYDNTAADVFEANDALVFDKGGTRIKTEFATEGERIGETDYYAFTSVDLSAIKELKIL